MLPKFSSFPGVILLSLKRLWFWTEFNFPNRALWYIPVVPEQGQCRSIQAQGQPRLMQIGQAMFYHETFMTQPQIFQWRYLKLVLKPIMTMIDKCKNVMENLIFIFKQTSDSFPIQVHLLKSRRDKSTCQKIRSRRALTVWNYSYTFLLLQLWKLNCVPPVLHALPLSLGSVNIPQVTSHLCLKLLPGNAYWKKS